MTLPFISDYRGAAPNHATRSRLAIRLQGKPTSHRHAMCRSSMKKVFKQYTLNIAEFRFTKLQHFCINGSNRYVPSKQIIMQCHKGAKLKHLILSEYYTSSFSGDFTAIIRYYIAVIIISSIPSAKYTEPNEDGVRGRLSTRASILIST